MEFEQIAMIADKDFSVQHTITEKGWQWARDIVTAKGVMLDVPGMRIVQNIAELRFNYDMFPGKEFELLHYRSGANFIGARISGALSHFGVHVPKIDDFRLNMLEKGFFLVQEVVTVHHTNVPDDRHYRYAIYRHNATSVAWKLIERLSLTDWDTAQREMNERYNRDIF